MQTFAAIFAECRKRLGPRLDQCRMRSNVGRASRRGWLGGAASRKLAPINKAQLLQGLQKLGSAKHGCRLLVLTVMLLQSAPLAKL